MNLKLEEMPYGVDNSAIRQPIHLRHIMASTSTTRRKKAAAKRAVADPVGVYTVRISEENPEGEPMTVRFGRSLGLKTRSRMGLIRAIKKGLDISKFSHLSKEINIQEKELAKFATISYRTLARRKESGRLSSDESDRVARISMLFDEAVDLFEGDKARASTWFLTPKKSLGDATPIEYAETEPGTQEVRDLIGRIEHGVFS